MSILAKFKPKRAVETILSDFHKVVAELKSVAAHHDDQATEKSAHVEELLIEKAAHVAEASAARVVAAKIAALVTPGV